MRSFIAVSALFAASALAVPTYGSKKVIVTLGGADELATTVSFKNVNSRKEKPVAVHGPFETITIDVGAGVADQDLRCQALDASGNPLVATRNANIDTSFSDADKGAWTFQDPDAEVYSVVCDPAIEAITADNFQTTVILSGPGELATQTVFDNQFVSTTQSPVGSAGPYNTVELSVGAMVNPELRCAVFDLKGRPIVVLRGANRDTTFSDADKGPWTFEVGNKKVGSITCDPTFVANNTA